MAVPFFFFDGRKTWSIQQVMTTYHELQHHGTVPAPGIAVLLSEGVKLTTDPIECEG
jgi:hypothetical protein